MKIDPKRITIAQARACLQTSEFLLLAGIPRGTWNSVLFHKSASPATVGKIAKALNCDVTELLKQ